MCDAVWQCALNALYGVIFKNQQEAAFANYRLWESLGFCAAFAYGSAFTAEVKLYICVAFLVLGIYLYEKKCLNFFKEWLGIQSLKYKLPKMRKLRRIIAERSMRRLIRR